MGWIETYIDPTNERAYYESWVAIVNKKKSEKFQNLVVHSEHIIPLLPWPRHMEKDSFLAPDFTTLDVLCFAANGCPEAINIPNYDDIREAEGFKNVFLNNSGSYTINATQFTTEEQSKLLVDWTQRCYEIHVACHELLGHGVGKLIYREKEESKEEAKRGSVMTFEDLDRGDTFQSCYEDGDTWNSKFGEISASFEECRADTCGFFLCTLPEVYKLFGFVEEEIPTLLWVNLMNQLRMGILGL
jgi:dipeptidyl-peptidase-3